MDTYYLLIPKIFEIKQIVYHFNVTVSYFDFQRFDDLKSYIIY